MQISDPIADMLTRLRNASRAGHKSVVMPSSKVKVAIADVLQNEGYIDGYEVVQVGPGSELRISLRYDADREPSIHGARRVSKPGLRVYAKRDDVPRVLGGLGLSIISTPKGVLSGSQAYRRRLGGEVLAYVW